MTGMKYPCKGDVRLLKSTMEHLEKTMPEMLVVKTYNKYGAVLKVVEADDEAEMEATRGVISRMDLPEMLQLMAFTGYDVQKARMVELSAQGAFGVLEVDVRPHGKGAVTLVRMVELSVQGMVAVLEVDVPEDFEAMEYVKRYSVWDDWSWMDALATEGVLDYEMFSEAEEAIKMLDLGLEKPGTLSDAMVTRNVNRLIKASRCDVSKETQAALARYRRLVAEHPSEKVRAMQERLVKAINDIGSAERREAFRTEYYPQIKARLDERRKMMEALHPDLNGEVLRQSAYEALKRLPDNLYLDIMDKGELMHRLLYLGGGIPRKKLYMLLDALSVWDGVPKEKSVGDDWCAVEELGTEEARLLMNQYVEAGLLGEDLQPKGISNPEAAYVASCISQRLWQENRWKPFEELWGISKLSSYYQRALCQKKFAKFIELVGRIDK